MKFIKVLLIIVIMSLMTARAAMAENSLKSGAKALSFGVVDSGIEVSGRLFVNHDVAVLGGIGLAHASNDETTTDFSLSAGIRKYLGRSDLAPFVGGVASFRRNEIVVVNIGPTGGMSVKSERTFALDGVFGLEYFFAKQVSAEAQAGVGLSDIHTVKGSGADVTKIGTFSSGVTVNFYLP